MAASKLLALITTTLLLAIPVIRSEEPFCGNKCHGRGIATSTACYCDEACSTLFNDCCGDSEHLFARIGERNYEKRRLMSCETIGKEKVLVVRKCPKSWIGLENIRQACQRDSANYSDPLSWIQVTIPSNGVTYGNYYCAICNGEVQKLFFWHVKITCPTLHSNFLLDSNDIFSYIYYNRSSDQWGFTVRDDKGYETFHGCDLNPAVPQQMSQTVRHCDTKEVNTCDQNWKRDIIRLMCGRYSDPVYSNGTQYKNFYCAICNNEDQSRFTCGKAVGPRHGTPPETVDSLNFALLLDVNFSDGGNVGKKKLTCDGKEDVYDPFKRQCRNIVCGLPGYTLSNGRCVPEN